MKTENLLGYYTNIKKEIPLDLIHSQRNALHFNVIKTESCMLSLPYARRDYYKITLTQNPGILTTDQGELKVDRPTIFFSRPEVNYGWEPLAANQDGYVCLFNESFLTKEMKLEFDRVHEEMKAKPFTYIHLDQAKFQDLFFYFERLASEHMDGHMFKNEIIDSILRLIIYNVIKVHRETIDGQRIPASNRLIHQFFTLLNNQFPLESPQQILYLKSPADYANRLNTHINHLNHLLKAMTGKSTSQHIQERLLLEGKKLLENSDWTIGQIGQGLGFEYPQHFTSFFKKHALITPKIHRERFMKQV
ncbi:helix-turn-helix domain-containing protein [Sphingobacterium sp. IITKGP-BTPF85]|uniref:helix-turn-helix domain-containing protein n=1 Tax=Sphingobacterium sp. IITKGP-BTPF85 TaxID=1338009 RepID=UPI000389E240|nr:AraC family transcriptional regulator [Sphingobacterium sp. IITKGP-BTPF85]KKX46641.1 hypothetical protein L950_0230795 [Sphingobacterium sp. IITKGP-BTPF85]